MTREIEKLELQVQYLRERIRHYYNLFKESNLSEEDFEEETFINQ